MNYPPGVTGLEPQIAGPDAERDEEREVPECPNLGSLVVTRRWSRGMSLPVVWLASRHRGHRRVHAEVCRFEGGEVSGTVVFWSQTATFIWDCPSCNAEHDREVDIEDYAPDPDQYR